MLATAPPSSLSLADLERHDPGAKPGGIERRFLCPFPACAGNQNPKAHRSISVNTQTGAWQCWRCHSDGKLREWQTAPSERAARPFVSKRDRERDRLRSLLEVKPRSVVPTAPAGSVEHQPASLPGPLLAGIQPLAGTSGAEYLAGRGLPLEFCHTAGVRFASNYFGRPAVVFPLRDAASLLVAMHGRYIDGRTDPKSRTKGPMTQAVYATPNAWSGDPWQGRVIVTEAPIDALTLAFCGVPAVAICGTSGGRELLSYFLKLGQAIAAFDADNAGREAGRALAVMLAPVGGQVLRMFPPEAHKDWNAALQAIGQDELSDYLASELSSGQTVPAPAPVSSPPVAASTPLPVAPIVPACPFCDVAPVSDPDALLAFVQAAHWGTGLDIQQAEGRVVLVERGFVTSVWAGPASGRLATGSDYWKPIVKPFSAVGQMA